MNKRVKYLKISVLPTLFGEWLLTKELGSAAARKPSAVYLEYFGVRFDAIKAYSESMLLEITNGYSKNRTAAPKRSFLS